MILEPSKQTMDDQNTEKIILEAAEAEFLEKGYANAKVISIANRANVSHSMLHYYFRSKEKLFQVVFEEKLHEISTIFEDIFNRNLTFNQTIRLFIETQFNFMAQNPKVPYFMLTEILTNPDNRKLVFSILSNKVQILSRKLEERLQAEINEGNIRQITFHDLLLDIASINVFTFIAMPILEDLIPSETDNRKVILDARRESNINFIISSLRP